MSHQYPEVLVRQPCAFCESSNTEPLRGKTFCNNCGRLFEVIKASPTEGEADKTWNAAIEEAIRIARRNGATATVLAIRKLLRPIEGENK